MLMLYAETSIRKCLPHLNLIEAELNQPLLKIFLKNQPCGISQEIFEDVYEVHLLGINYDFYQENCLSNNQ